ncbi:SufE family protein [Ferrimonas balearica]|nr:SufE family protein [Ferrimonas balearica]MBW3165691.1 SufE family protein [Ferrimonas balearica]MBY5981601.1 SufE family protein [Ferrimonas balearica]
MMIPSEAAFRENPVGPTLTREQLDAELKAQGHWQGRYRLLMKLGSRMPALAPQWHKADAEVAGCESATWLYHQELEGRHYFLADSEARIVRGLLVLVLAACNGRSSAELAQVGLDEWFRELGLADHLSPSRASGLNAVVRQILALADQI